MVDAKTASMIMYRGAKFNLPTLTTKNYWFKRLLRRLTGNNEAVKPVM
jgi:hypothetical protein